MLLNLKIIEKKEDDNFKNKIKENLFYSILNQSLKPNKILVVNDCSSDNTMQILISKQYCRVSYILYCENIFSKLRGV